MRHRWWLVVWVWAGGLLSGIEGGEGVHVGEELAHASALGVAPCEEFVAFGFWHGGIADECLQIALDGGCGGLEFVCGVLGELAFDALFLAFAVFVAASEVVCGWFITAGAAFIFCFLLTLAMYYGSYVAMALAIALAVYLLIRSNFRKADKTTKTEDTLFTQILREKDKTIIWQLLCQHIRRGNAARLQFVIDTYGSMTDASTAVLSPCSRQPTSPMPNRSATTAPLCNSASPPTASSLWTACRTRPLTSTLSSSPSTSYRKARNSSALSVT